MSEPLTKQDHMAAALYVDGPVVGLAEALAVVAKDEIPLAVVGEMLSVLPRNAHAGDVRAEALVGALAGTFDTLGVTTEKQAEKAFRRALKPLAKLGSAHRETIGRLIATAIRQSPWPESFCLQLLSVMSEILALEVRVSRVTPPPV